MKPIWKCAYFVKASKSQLLWLQIRLYSLMWENSLSIIIFYGLFQDFIGVYMSWYDRWTFTIWTKVLGWRYLVSLKIPCIFKFWCFQSRCHRSIKSSFLPFSLPLQIFVREWVIHRCCCNRMPLQQVINVFSPTCSTINFIGTEHVKLQGSVV